MVGKTESKSCSHVLHPPLACSLAVCVFFSLRSVLVGIVCSCSAAKESVSESSSSSFEYQSCGGLSINSQVSLALCKWSVLLVKNRSLLSESRRAKLVSTLENEFSIG
jgi:hypothetical protein